MPDEGDAATVRSPLSLAAVTLATITFLFTQALVFAGYGVLAIIGDGGPMPGPFDQPILFVIPVGVISIIPAYLSARYAYRRVGWSYQKRLAHRRKGMHWLLRGLIAVGAAYLVNGLMTTALWTIAYGVAPFGQALAMAFMPHIHNLIYWPLLAVPLIVFARLTKRYGPITLDRETRCRQCQYILRGISEPRCPECGERI